MEYHPPRLSPSIRPSYAGRDGDDKWGGETPLRDQLSGNWNSKWPRSNAPLEFPLSLITPSSPSLNGSRRRRSFGYMVGGFHTGGGTLVRIMKHSNNNTQITSELPWQTIVFQTPLSGLSKRFEQTAMTCSTIPRMWLLYSSNAQRNKFKLLHRRCCSKQPLHLAIAWIERRAAWLKQHSRPSKPKVLQLALQTTTRATPR